MQILSLAAMEEASRTGSRDADLEHLFLALALSDQAAGTALRAAGVTLARAREAVQAMHSEQLNSIGISLSAPQPGRIVFHETRGYEWTPRALDVFKRAGDQGSGDAAAVLRELLVEPGGLIEDLLERLDTSAADITSALTTVTTSSTVTTPARSTAASGSINGSTETFVPAEVDVVWALLSDPTRMPEWNPSVGSVEFAENGDGQGATTWLAVVPAVHPDGKPARVKEKFRRRQMELTESVPLERIAWRTSYPAIKRGNTNVLAIDLAPAPGGTRLQLTVSWTRRGGWRRLFSWVLRPLQRFLMWLGLFQIGAGISRAFR
ncbi:Clp protease [Mycetocola zhadangensis]|uniref:Clp protease n=2 Tax=Mycetocola zhadangensis TaxID=1164595 RepID=A0A3L7ITK9_9MICO|nr:Clp protease [Mycetocola zhadangensis]